ncbi:MAG TPA: hypothetical protein VES64_07570 [Allosphingosinicella sp.]|nr:hypothetical protein [Allosphingosinicella sp.]
MFGLIGLLTPRLGATLAKVVVYGGLVLLVLLALWYYGHTRYERGVRDTDAKWVEAGRRLQAAAARSATKADDAAAARAAEHDARVIVERREIEHAQANNASTFDVLFR